jgi:hypothetical protein
MMEGGPDVLDCPVTMPSEIVIGFMKLVMRSVQQRDALVVRTGRRRLLFGLLGVLSLLLHLFLASFLLFFLGCVLLFGVVLCLG